MKAFVLHGKEDLRPAELPVLQPSTGAVIVRVRRAGICGSDIHYFSHGRVGNFVPKRPFVLGHEFAGEIVALGAGVDPSLEGRRVAVDPSMPCGVCQHCRNGRYNLCLNMRFYGSASCDPHIDGGYQEFVAVPVSNCVEVAEGVTWGEAAMTEPLSVSIHAVNRAGAVGGKTALVTGGGAIGQLIALVLRAFGASTIALSDVAAFPREVAVRCGADFAIDAADFDFFGRANAAVSDGFDFVFEASGSPKALEQAISVARRGGTIVQVGTLPTPVTASINGVMQKELNLLGSFRFAHAFQAALDLIASRRIDVKPLITGVFALEDMEVAMHAAISKTNSIKIQVEP
ncbi:MAG: L-idonate 5-dehydrogenase [Rhizobium sp.]|nr:L-idonate 5-dehydrogenase [Rhizobium sp.]